MLIRHVLKIMPARKIKRGLPAISKTLPVPFEQWPMWAKGFSLVKIDGEKGVGDTAHRIFHSPGAGQISEGIVAGLKLFKIGCGCARRQAQWNTIYPY